MATRTCIGIAADVLQQWPEARVGILLAQVPNQQSKSGPVAKYLSNLKQEVVRGVSRDGITGNNFQDLRVCQSWNHVFSTFGTKGMESTIVRLIGRAAMQGDKLREGKIKNADMGKISDPVDLYNCVSIETRTPMGALCLNGIRGNLVLRYGQQGETFTTLGRVEETYPVQPGDIVYADEHSVVTWLWNYMDAKHACIPRPDKSDKLVDVIFFADQAEENAGDAKLAIETLAQRIEHIGGRVIQLGQLDRENPVLELV